MNMSPVGKRLRIMVVHWSLLAKECKQIFSVGNLTKDRFYFVPKTYELIEMGESFVLLFWDSFCELDRRAFCPALQGRGGEGG